MERVVAPLTAYNLTVEEFSTFFVAANVDAEPVWVHNSCKTYQTWMENCSWVATRRMKAMLREARMETANTGDIAIPSAKRLIEPRLYAEILAVHVPFDWAPYLAWQGGHDATLCGGQVE
ncbi:hypothetical protein RNZ50_01075 [Paracoccaceae bacterium Fryx2]|nr:hypothetical protein [Paracoccaceae bacterium Fryx2]